jgi:guanylate kinase
MQRLEKRGQMSSVEKASRLNSARLELEEALRQPRFILVTNYDIHRAAHEILGGTTDPRIQAQNRELAQTLISHIQSY